jgi:hypothetical protein
MRSLSSLRPQIFATLWQKSNAGRALGRPRAVHKNKLFAVFVSCPLRTASKASGSLATFTSRTILPVSSTMQTLVSLTDTSSPAQWSSRADNWHPCCAQNLQKFERFPVKGDLKAVSVSHTPYSRIS